jgi:Holliday junction DNA helicase RuvA
MIGRLRGELIELDGPLAVVDCSGVGYEVLIPDSAALELPDVGARVELYTRQVFREDGVTLYGFSNAFQRRVFDLLREVKGCGPKIALAVIGQVGAEEAASAIVSQDAKTLTAASGVGARLAERILLELKDKMAEERFQLRVVGQVARLRPAPADELVDALMTLGYRRQEAENMADGARDLAPTVEEQLRLALQQISR